VVRSYSWPKTWGSRGNAKKLAKELGAEKCWASELSVLSGQWSVVSGARRCRLTSDLRPPDSRFFVHHLFVCFRLVCNPFRVGAGVGDGYPGWRCADPGLWCVTALRYELPADRHGSVLAAACSALRTFGSLAREGEPRTKHYAERVMRAARGPRNEWYSPRRPTGVDVRMP